MMALSRLAISVCERARAHIQQKRFNHQRREGGEKGEGREKRVTGWNDNNQEWNPSLEQQQ